MSGAAAAAPVRRLAVIGCGLMGGSFARALRARGLLQQAVGVARSAEARARAVALGVVDEATDDPAAAARGADVVLLAVPVAATEATLRALAPALADDALLMDVGSTKADVVAAARAALDAARLARFVPAHPIAGKEKAGVEHACAELYRGAQVIVTPLPETAADAQRRAQALWEAVGARVRTMTPQAHDAALAAVSHLPHLLAFAAVHALAQQPDGARFLELAGPGFRDFTRIAASDPDVWRDILHANAAEVRAQAAAFRAALDAFEAALAEPARLRLLIDEASRVRRAWAPAGAPPSP
ncbi:Prephenate dehydrogenase [Tepidimonas alkaliphilus]|uniref:Prephenate dehydrogenase n=1 Tax=Tepidimonas alkaliphilus TaxID=2588942 RepID=A0A554W440_9BURK|nr:prephenate dehydrogenase/arogenate dehydrogenase family protein [Tepidimonas alkaliphilus]TSE18348.1 Prephenate dehydrogenase [Tepidimonas alkaliphilus]